VILTSVAATPLTTTSVEIDLTGASLAGAATAGAATVGTATTGTASVEASLEARFNQTNIDLLNILMETSESDAIVMSECQILNS